MDPDMGGHWSWRASTGGFLEPFHAYAAFLRRVEKGGSYGDSRGELAVIPLARLWTGKRNAYCHASLQGDIAV